MRPHLVEITGDMIEVLGVFLLSVEAIKPENLYKLRDRVFLPLQHGLQPGIVQPQKTRWTPEEFRIEHQELRRFFVSHYGAGFAIVAGAMLIASYLSLSVRSFFFSITATPSRTAVTVIVLLVGLLPLALAIFGTRKNTLSPPLVVMIAVVMASIPIGMVPMALGEAAHQGSRLVVRVVLRALQLIDEGTPTGTIGILGFVAVCIGKLVKLLASFF